MQKKERIANDFRWQAIERVIDIIKEFPHKIISSSQLKGIKGSVRDRDRIDEILSTGKLSEIKPFQEEYQKYVEQLHAIYARRALEWGYKIWC
jgi:hypothetical protein